MSSIDNRIVQMQFENSQFEKGIKDSIKSIEGLKRKLEFNEAEKSIKELQKVGDSFSLASMANGIEKINEKFSVMGIIGKRVLEDITDKAVRMGESFVKSVSIDQIAAGWQKYADKTASVQTIIAATGQDIETVNEQLSKLAWFTDETSYNFVDMTSNIGKFTSMGIDLETSVTAMEGIATWAAVSGQNAQSASRAMYNLSQAIGVGAVKLMDWKSIENANMATKEFKQTAIATAKALGKISKAGKTAKGTLVTFENFSSTLAEGWFTKDVLLKTLEQYGNYANEVYKVATEKGITAAEAMKYVSAETMQLGEKAFKAAQEAKTFGEAIDSVKDAVSTGFMNMFENVFGNYEEAKVLWTDLANYLWDIFASPLADTNEMLARWKELGGRSKMLKGIYDIFHALADIIYTVGDALSEVFPPLTAERLVQMSEAVQNFGAAFRRNFARYETSFDVPIKKQDTLTKLINENKFALNDTSDAVGELQDELVKLGYLTEGTFVRNIFGPSSFEALQKYQNGIDVTAKKIENAFKIGDKGDDVKKLQQQLIDLHYDVGKTGVDGIYGPKTKAAFEKYEKSLDSASKKRRKLAKGDRGEDVKELQEALIKAGKLDKGQADGIFGPKTEAALKEYQKAKKITESGILDEDTYKHIFPEKIATNADEIEHETRVTVDYTDKMQNLYRITRGVGSALHVLGTLFGFVGKVVAHVGSLLSPLADAFIAIGAAISDAITSFDKWLSSSGALDEWFEKAKNFFEPFGKWVEKAADGLLIFFGISKQVNNGNKEMLTFSKIINNIRESIKNTGIVDKFVKSWKKLTGVFKAIAPSLKAQWKAFKDALGEKFSNLISSIPDKIAAITEVIGNLVSKGFDLITPWIRKIPSAVDKIKGFWAAITQEGDSATGKAPGFLLKVRDAFKSVVDYLFGSGDISSGKQPGLFRRLWSFISGNLIEFEEGIGEESKRKIISAIQGVKNFIEKVREAVIVLFGGDVGEDKKISDETIKKINNFKASINNILLSIRYLFSDKDDGDAMQLSTEVKTKLDNFKTGFLRIANNVIDFFKSVWATIKAFFTGDTDDEKILNFRNSVIGIFNAVKDFLVSIWNTIKGLFTGEVKFDSIGGFFASIWENIKNLVTQISGVLSENYNIAIGNIGKFFEKTWDIVKKFAKWAIIGVILIKTIRFVGNVGNIFERLRSAIDRLKGKTQPLSKSILQFSIAVGIIAASIIGLSLLKDYQISQGLNAFAKIVESIGGFIALSVVLGALGLDKAIAKIGKAVMEIGIAVGILAAVLAILAIFPAEDFKVAFERMIKCAAVMAGFMVVIGGINKLFGSIKVALKGFWQVAILLGVMSLITKMLGKMEPEDLDNGLKALVGIMFLISALFMIMGGFGSTNIKLKGLFTLALLIGVMGLVTKRLGKMKAEELDRGLKALLGIMVMLSGVFYILGKFTTGLNPIPILATMAGVSAVIFVFGKMAKDIKDVDWKVIAAFGASISAMLLTVGPALTALSAIPILAALKGCLNLVLVVAAIGIALNVFSFFGGNALDNFGSAIYLLSADLSNFANNMSELDEGAASKVYTFIGTIVEALVGIAKVDYIAVDNFGVALTRVGASIGIFTTLTSSLTEDRSSVTKSFIFGMGLSLRTISGIDYDSVESFASGLTRLGGAIETFVGNASGLTSNNNQQLTDFVDTVSGLGEGLKTFITNSSGIYSALSSVGGALGVFYGNLATVKVDENGEVNTESVQAAFNAIAKLNIDETAIANVAKYADEGEGAILNSFAIGLQNLSVAIGAYGEKIGSLNVNAVTTANTALEGIVDIKERVESINSFGEFMGAVIGKKDEFPLFVDDIAALGEALKNYGEKIGGLNVGSVALASLVLGSIVGIKKRVESIDSFGEFMGAVIGKKDEFPLFVDDVAALGGALGDYGTNIGGLVKEDIINANSILTTIDGLDIPFTGGIWQLGRGKQDLGKFATNIARIGTGMANYMNNISGADFDKTKIENSLIPLTTIASVQSTLKESGGITQLWTGTQNLGKLGEQLASFGNHLVTFSDSVKDFELTSNISSAISVLTDIVGLQNSLSQSATDFYALEIIGSSLENFFNSLARIDTNATGDMLNEGTTMDDALDAAYYLEQLDSSEIVTSITNYVSEICTAIANGNDQINDGMHTAGIGLIDALSAGMNDTAFTAPNDIASSALTAIQSYSAGFNTVGYNYAIGLANGISSGADEAINAAASIALAMVSVIRGIFDVNSPSKVTTQIGKYFTEGLAIGTEDKMGQAVDTVNKVAGSMLDTASGTLSSLSEILAEDIDDTPVISPVVDLTNARASAATIGSMFGNQTFGVSSQYMAKSAQMSTDNGRPVTIQNGTINTSEAVSSVNDQLNALSQAIASRNNGSTDNGTTSLSERFGELADAITHLKIVLDSGILVGEIMPMVDSGLGDYSMRRSRGN